MLKGTSPKFGDNPFKSESHLIIYSYGIGLKHRLKGQEMRIYLVGVTCVGKTTVGGLLAKRLGYEFVDFDEETKREFKVPLLELHNRYRTNKGYREATRPLLARILTEHPNNVVIAMPPGGLFREYKSVLDQDHPDVVTIWMKDCAENIFKRLIFTDDYDNLITEPVINDDNAWWYLKDVREDLLYYSKTHSKAAIHFDVAGKNAEQTAGALAELLLALEQIGPTGNLAGQLTKTVPAFTLRLTFMFYELVCWREICVPRSYTFRQLHFAIQRCINWDYDHLYDFQYTSKETKYHVSERDPWTGGSPFDAALFMPKGGFPVWREASEATIEEVFRRGCKVYYTYDYGDNWVIAIQKLGSTIPLDSASPLCLAGEGDNPPEDVGGELGFMRALRARDEYDPNDPDSYDEDAYWVIEPFDLHRTNQRFGRS